MSQDSLRTDPPAAGDLPLPRRGAARVGDGPIADPELVEQTRSQIRHLVQEISDLARSQVEPARFHEGFLIRVTSALASVGGAIWLRGAAGQPLDLQYQINLSQTELAASQTAREAHARLLDGIIAAGEPALVPPHSGAEEGAAGNPTGLLLILAPLVVEGQVAGLVEIFQRPGGGPATQRGYLRFVIQMGELASEYLTHQRLRSVTRQQQHWHELEQFARIVHQRLDRQQAACSIANEARRMLDCDRVSVAEWRGGRATILAVSGLDTIERRAEQVRLLGNLATTVLRAGQPVWHDGTDQALAPQIDAAIHRYVDVSQSRMVAVIPLTRDEGGQDTSIPDPRRPAPRPRIAGALILENLRDSRVAAPLRERAGRLAVHAGLALGNALEHDGIFLMPLWKALAPLAIPFQQRFLPRTAAVLAAMVIAAGSLWLVPWPFTLGSQGQLIAETQREIYARIAGTLTDVLEPASPQQVIPAGTVLATMLNSELLQQIEAAEGKLAVSREQIAALDRALGMESNPAQKIQIAGDLAAERQNERSLQFELELLRARSADLTVRCPIDGRLANWQLRRNLLGRPVETGQNLMTVIAPDTAWQVELFVPEKRVGHLLERMQASDHPLDVSFSLASRPGLELRGRLVTVEPVLDVHGEHGNTARVLVSFDNADLPEDLRRSGTRITGRIHCGNRPLGYVLFHELLETVQSSWRMWF